MSLSDYVQLMKLRIDALLLLVAASGYVATSGTHVDPVRFSLLILSGFLGAAGIASTTSRGYSRPAGFAIRSRSFCIRTVASAGELTVSQGASGGSAEPGAGRPDEGPRSGRSGSFLRRLSK